MVLRRFVRRPGSDRNDGRWVRQEAEVLQALTKTDLPAPRLLDCDPEGKSAGGWPALLMTRLPGRIFLTPEDGRAWLKQVASLLANPKVTIVIDDGTVVVVASVHEQAELSMWSWRRDSNGLGERRPIGEHPSNANLRMTRTNRGFALAWLGRFEFSDVARVQLIDCCEE